MNFYIVDDDPAIPAILHQIIENNPENTVVGKSTNAKKAKTKNKVYYDFTSP
ncbi:response regulator [Liquorilactobacillus nagelii]|uniref:hypothetical protein n=1 Tax=Liquorilactobacillus nagelii TaxID=82688 RepID=UPI0021C27082|nr:hypothetical protein [Liquorilactobacillus nagelii]